jgi:hypothetical protein
VIALTASLLAGLALGARAAGPATLTGSPPDGATYLIQAPENWNGTLVLYSHGIVIPGRPNPARGVGDSLTGHYLLGRGYALTGSSYATTSWAVQDGLADQIATLAVFGSLVGHPCRTIAWGHSLGGMITAGLAFTQNSLCAAAAAQSLCSRAAPNGGLARVSREQR